MEEIKIIRLGNLYDQHDRWGVIHIKGLVSTLTASMGLGGGHVPMIVVKKDDRYISNENSL